MRSSIYILIAVFAFAFPSLVFLLRKLSIFISLMSFLFLCSECITVVLENRASVVQNMFVRGFEQSGQTDLENTEDKG